MTHLYSISVISSLEELEGEFDSFGVIHRDDPGTHDVVGVVAGEVGGLNRAVDAGEFPTTLRSHCEVTCRILRHCLYQSPKFYILPKLSRVFVCMYMCG